MIDFLSLLVGAQHERQERARPAGPTPEYGLDPGPPQALVELQGVDPGGKVEVLHR